MNLFFSVFPIIFLIYLMTKKNSLPSQKALPIAAVTIYLIKLIYFKADPNLLNATVFYGLLTAFTPILIIWGAILLFMTLEYSGGMEIIRNWLNDVSSNRIAQLMIISWAFSFLIEGASGFGTPAALAAPILVGLGFEPLKIAILCLIMNSVPVSFGAVGTPTWFGFKEVGLTNIEILQIGFKTALIHGVAALIIPVFALSFVISWKEIKENLLFIYLSILSCIIPYILLAKINYEFPTILGGLIGLILSIYFAKFGIGLKSKNNQTSKKIVNYAKLIKMTFPLWFTIFILLITRIKQLGLKDILLAKEPSIEFVLGSLGNLSISPSLVISLKNIFLTKISWVHNVLYVPSIIPFLLVCIISFWFYKLKISTIKNIFSVTYERIHNPIVALLSALVFVKLLMFGDDFSCTMIIGNSFASYFGQKWQFFSVYLGGIGSFFAGSNTISNLTFGGIQNSIAKNLGLDRIIILSLQSVGGAMGNMICINNIVAVCSILGIENKDGYILKRTILPWIVYGIISGIISYLI